MKNPLGGHASVVRTISIARLFVALMATAFGVDIGTDIVRDEAADFDAISRQGLLMESLGDDAKRGIGTSLKALFYALSLAVVLYASPPGLPEKQPRERPGTTQVSKQEVSWGGPRRVEISIPQGLLQGSGEALSGALNNQAAGLAALLTEQLPIGAQKLVRIVELEFSTRDGWLVVSVEMKFSKGASSEFATGATRVAEDLCRKLLEEKMSAVVADQGKNSGDTLWAVVERVVARQLLPGGRKST